MKTLCLPAFLALLLAPSSGLAAEQEQAGVLTREPSVVQAAEPEYPAEARESGLAAEVYLEIEISETGEVVAARVTRSAGHGFDEAALAAAQKMRFSPAEIDGKPAAVRIEYRYKFEFKAPPPEQAKTEAAAGPTANLKGLVLERGTKTPLVGAMVDLNEGAFTTSTDAEGRFELQDLPPGTVKVVVVESAHRRFETTETLEAGKLTEVKYYLRKTVQGSYETVVVGQKERKEVATVSISAVEVSKIPGVYGDTVKVVQNLPGVARAPDMSGLLIVRGSNANDSRLYIDGVDVPLIFHFGSITSIYPADLVQDVEFEPGNFGARYGRATAGRVEIKTRDPSFKQLHLVADANLYHAMAFVEAPVSDTVAVAFAARRSYVDVLLNAAAPLSSEDGPSFSVAPRYYDYQGKLTWKPSKADSLRLSLFGSDDGMRLVGIKTGGLEDIDALKFVTRFGVLSAAWDHQFSPTTRSSLLVSEQLIKVQASIGGFMDDDENYNITAVRADVYHELHPRLTFGGGLDLRYQPGGKLRVKIPAIPEPNQMYVDSTPKRWEQDVEAYELGAWTEVVWKPWDNLTLVPGVRVDAVDILAKGSWIDPRFAARWMVRDGTVLKGGIGIFHQPPMAAYATTEWGNPDLKQEGSRQYSVGVEQRIRGPISADVQLYYKSLFDLVLPSLRTVVRDGQLVDERFSNAGTGKAYGAELLLRYNPDGRFFGWLAYSLSKSKRDQNVVGGRIDATGDEFDQPHNLTAVGTLELPEVWNGLSAGFRLRYTSGNPYRKVTGSAYDVDWNDFQRISEQEVSSRLPAFFQLDLRVDKKWTFQTWTLGAYLDVQNVTNRKNVVQVTYNHDYTLSGYLTGLPIFPSFGLRAEY
jgi:TonB family protein